MVLLQQEKNGNGLMAIYTVSITVALYGLTCLSCLKDKDYPHALMWFAYGLANVGLLWYEFKKATKP